MILRLTLAQIGCGLLLASWLTPRSKVGDSLLRLFLFLAGALLLPLAAVSHSPGTASVPLLGSAAAACIGSGILFHWGAGRPATVGTALATILATGGLILTVLPLRPAPNGSGADAWLLPIDTLTSALLLGATLGAMLLGHSYLTNFGMSVAPLSRLALLMGAAAVAKAAVVLATLAVYGWPPTRVGWLMALLLPPGLLYLVRIAVGIGGPLAFAPLIWHTTRIHSTQSATGILYAALVLVLIGEMTANFLMTQTPFPF